MPKTTKKPCRAAKPTTPYNKPDRVTRSQREGPETDLFHHDSPGHKPQPKPKAKKTGPRNCDEDNNNNKDDDEDMHDITPGDGPNDAENTSSTSDANNANANTNSAEMVLYSSRPALFTDHAVPGTILQAQPSALGETRTGPTIAGGQRAQRIGTVVIGAAMVAVGAAVVLQGNNPNETCEAVVSVVGTLLEDLPWATMQ